MSDSNWNTDGQVWRTIKPPLVPTEEDIGLVLEACRPTIEGLGRSPRILVLGVTPALLDAPWPKGSEIHSVDYDEVMIEIMWKDGEGRRGHCSDWRSMPFSDGLFDLVVGDCSFNALPGLQEYPSVLKEIGRVSAPGARLVCRFFMQSTPRLTLVELPAETVGLAPSSVRLLLAIASADDEGALRFTDVFRLLAEEGLDFGDYLSELGHDTADIERTRKILQADQRLNYPTREQIEPLFEPFYSQVELQHPTYDVGRFCPILRFS